MMYVDSADWSSKMLSSIGRWRLFALLNIECSKLTTITMTATIIADKN